ncbi:hypothetical protein BJ988_000638 [Nocardioides panzhihuensis]|uniref:Uncharacterized protein n=1 Tax=Nocardioides panzhihuensis TaxID=860243 RepID=A0A7Z0DII4_9ACTN|nr:hypothetical protein [Nocardioides panzhihuensis]NYI75990.1 hypothetical protein [Nocardioides panzhihuensis]
MNTVAFGAKATARVSTENSAMLLISVTRRPNRSASGPMATAPMPTPTRPSVAAVVSDALVNPSAPVSAKVGITAPSTTRS